VVLPVHLVVIVPNQAAESVLKKHVRNWIHLACGPKQDLLQ